MSQALSLKTYLLPVTFMVAGLLLAVPAMATAKSTEVSTKVIAKDLFKLVEDGNLAGIKKTSADKLKTAENEHGETLLIRAIVSEKVSVWQYLLKNNATSVDHRDKEGNTALLYAVSAGDSAAVRALLAKSANLDFTYGENKDSILFEAVRIGEREVFELLLSKNTALANRLNSKNESPLIEAVRSAQAQLGLALVKEYGATFPSDPTLKSQLETALKANKSAQAKELLALMKN